MILASGGGVVNADGERCLTDHETAIAQRLLYVERHTSFPFKFILGDDKYTVTRTQIPLTHACVRTAQSTQGLTLKKGVILDCSKLSRMDADAWWLNLYVMLSRATSLQNLLLFNAPQTKAAWSALRPPKDLVERLKRFERLAALTKRVRER
jgi:hypothetical protein